MLLITGILMILAGALAAASLIAAKQPNAKQAIDKLVPFQGIIGIIAAIWGAYNVIMAIVHISWLTDAPIRWIVGFSTSLVMLILGFILGYALISKYTMKTPEAAAKGEELRLKLVKYQTPLGLIGIGLGLWAVIFSVTHGMI